MKESEDELDASKHQGEGSRLRLISNAKRESVRSDTKLKTLIEEMKGKEKQGRGKPSFEDDPDAA